MVVPIPHPQPLTAPAAAGGEAEGDQKHGKKQQSEHPADPKERPKPT